MVSSEETAIESFTKGDLSHIVVKQVAKLAYDHLEGRKIYSNELVDLAEEISM